MKSDVRTDVEKASAAKNLNSRQRHYDRLHHMRRVLWLEQFPCQYASGERVPEDFRLTLLRGSKDCLQRISDHGSSTRSVSLNDTDYLAVLDEFEKTGEYKVVGE